MRTMSMMAIWWALAAAAVVALGFACVMFVRRRALRAVKRMRELAAELAVNQGQLKLALTTAREAVQVKARFLATMSHEIRTPLNAVVGYAEMLDRPDLTPGETREYAHEVNRAAQTLLVLVDDILELSRIENGKSHVLTGDCDLVRLFADVETMYRSLAGKKGVKISVRVDPEFPIIGVSPQAMRQVLINLVGNALDVSQGGEVVLSAAISGRPEPGLVGVRIIVKDTGCGIPTERAKEVFEPFSRGIGLRDGGGRGGTGLGIPIAKRLVDAAHGRIAYESRKGSGSLFTVDFERLREMPRPAEEAHPPSELPREDQLMPLPSRPDGVHLLLVDDVEMNLKILALHAKRAGVARIGLVGSAEEALEYVRRESPDLVFTDIWMPGMSGPDLAMALKADPATRKIPVAAVTADTDPGASFDTAAFDMVITKPVDSAKIRAAIGKLAGNRA